MTETDRAQQIATLVLTWNSAHQLTSDQQQDPEYAAQLNELFNEGHAEGADRIARLATDPRIAKSKREEAQQRFVVNDSTKDDQTFALRREVIVELTQLEAVPQALELLHGLASAEDQYELFRVLINELIVSRHFSQVRSLLEAELADDPIRHFELRFDLYQHTELDEDLARARVLADASLSVATDTPMIARAVNIQLTFYETTHEERDLAQARNLAQAAQAPLERAEALQQIAEHTALREDFLAAVAALPKVESAESLQLLDVIVNNVVDARKNAEMEIDLPYLRPIKEEDFRLLLSQLRDLNPNAANEITRRWDEHLARSNESTEEAPQG